MIPFKYHIEQIWNRNFGSLKNVAIPGMSTFTIIIKTMILYTFRQVSHYTLRVDHYLWYNFCTIYYFSAILSCILCQIFLNNEVMISDYSCLFHACITNDKNCTVITSKLWRFMLYQVTYNQIIYNLSSLTDSH